jgi:Flp pilus assembly protein TadG
VTGTGVSLAKAGNFDEKGEAMVVWCLLVALLLLVIGGLSIDLWRGIAVQRQLQSAAEDAALAGASGIDVGAYRATGCLRLAPGVAVGLAETNLAQQPGADTISAASVSVDDGGKTIRVVLKEDVHLTLLRLVEGNTPLVVTAAATSGPVGSLSGTGC